MSESLDRFPPEVRSEMRQLWRRVLDPGAPTVTREALRDVARRVSTAAQGAGLASEQLLVAVKESWMVDSSTTHFRSVRDMSWALTDFVALCIAEFYRPQRVTSSPSDEAGARP